MTYDGNVIILIDQVDLMEEPDSNKESVAKFWLPQLWPERVNCIVNCEKDSKNYNYFQRIGCRILTIHSNEHIQDNYIEHVKNTNAFFSKNHVEKIWEVFHGYPKSVRDNFNFSAAFFGLLNFSADGNMSLYIKDDDKKF